MRPESGSKLLGNNYAISQIITKLDFVLQTMVS